jgi:hypothetical protein
MARCAHEALNCIFRTSDSRPPFCLTDESTASFLFMMIDSIIDKAPKWRCLLTVASLVALGLSSQTRVLSVVQDNSQDVSSDAREKHSTMKRLGTSFSVKAPLHASVVSEKPARESDYRFVICTRVR